MTPNVDEQNWEPGEHRLIPDSILGLWTPHGPRTLMPTWGRSLKFPKDNTIFLGCWRASASLNYVRSQRQAVEEIQIQTTLMARTFSEQDIYDEEGLFEKIAEQLIFFHFSIVQAVRTTENMKYFGNARPFVDYKTRPSEAAGASNNFSGRTEKAPRTPKLDLIPGIDFSPESSPEEEIAAEHKVEERSAEASRHSEQEAPVPLGG